MFAPNGTVMKPTTKAQAMHNVNKACELFIKDQVVDGEVLFRGKEIVEGDLNKAWGLLFKVWEGYGGLGGRGRRGDEMQKVRGTVKHPPPSRPSEAGGEEGGGAAEEDEAVEETYTPTWRKGGKREMGRIGRGGGKGGGRGGGEKDYLLEHEEVLRRIESRGGEEGEWGERQDRDRPGRGKRRSKGVGREMLNEDQAAEEREESGIETLAAHSSPSQAQTSAASLIPYVNYCPPTFKDPYTLSLLDQSLPHVSAQQVNHVHLWLHRLGFNPYNGGSGRHGVLRDNLRNGVLLCDVLELVEGGMCKGIGMEGKLRRRCDNVEDAVWNVSMGMDVMRNGRYRIKHRLTADPMEHVKGDKNAIYGLLWEMVQVYPPFVGAGMKENRWGKWSKKRGWRRYSPR